LLISLAERYSPRANEIRMDGMVLGFTLALTVVVALVLSFVATLPKEGTLGAWVAAGVTRMSANVRRQRLQRGLVVAQVAVSVVLLTGAGLLTRTMLQLSEVRTGLTTEEVLTMEVPFDYDARSDADAKARFERMRLEIGALPGVRVVGVGSTMPLRTTEVQLDVKAEGRPLAPGEPMPRAEFRTASPDYFRAAGIPILRGREFYSTDQRGSGLVVILNKTLADRLFPGRDPIGQRVAWTGDVLRFIGISGEWRTVVGVVGDTKDGGPDAEPRGVVFQPLAQEALFGGGLVIRAERNAAALAPAATRLVRSISPKDPIENVLTVPQIRDQSIAPRRLNAVLVSSFGGLAVIIAAVGIAGVLAFSVSARTNEIGIRMSLGADSRRVQRMVLMEGGVLLATGLVLGVAGAVLATRLIRGLLFGVAPHDPATLAGVAVLMATVGIAACWLPALRAARIDPAVAIRRQ
jgi:putative ABC transport system permease protein